MPHRSSSRAEGTVGVAGGLFPSLLSAFLDSRLSLWAWCLCLLIARTARNPRTPGTPRQPSVLPTESSSSPPRARHPGPPTSGPCPPAVRPTPAAQSKPEGTRASSPCGDGPQGPLPFTCLASLTESLVSRARSWGSRWAAGAISTTFWCRRWMEQSRSYRCRMFPYWSPGVGGKLTSASPGSEHLQTPDKPPASAAAHACLLPAVGAARRGTAHPERPRWPQDPDQASPHSPPSWGGSS